MDEKERVMAHVKLTEAYAHLVSLSERIGADPTLMSAFDCIETCLELITGHPMAAERH